MKRYVSKTKARRVMSEKTVSRGGHEYQCSICAHAERKEIEEAFVNWFAPGRIAKRYGVSRDAIYRHAHALSLMELRRRNVRAALEKIIEHACDVKTNAAAVVSAVSAYARINSRGELVERTQSVNLNQIVQQNDGRRTRGLRQNRGIAGVVRAHFGRNRYRRSR